MEEDIQAQLQQLEKIHQSNAQQTTEVKQVKRSSELLYLDPEEQGTTLSFFFNISDPFLINQANRPWKKPNITKPEASGGLC